MEIKNNSKVNVDYESTIFLIIDFNSIQYIDITMLAYSQDNMIKD